MTDLTIPYYTPPEDGRKQEFSSNISECCTCITITGAIHDEDDRLGGGGFSYTGVYSGCNLPLRPGQSMMKLTESGGGVQLHWSFFTPATKL